MATIIFLIKAIIIVFLVGVLGTFTIGAFSFYSSFYSSFDIDEGLKDVNFEKINERKK